MLELYHHGSSVCAAKVRLCLEEKSLDWKSHYVDILKGDQFSDTYRALNPKAIVPTLVHDGFVVTESTIICEYLEDAFPGTPLRPGNPEDHAASLYWTKAIDEFLHPLCAELTFACSHRYTVLALGKVKIKEFLDSTPDHSVTDAWHDRKKDIVLRGLNAPGVDSSIRKYVRFFEKMEVKLAGNAWLAGTGFSLAECAVIPYIMRLEMMAMQALWEKGRLPRVARWLKQCKERPSFEKAIWEWMPESLIHDLATNGRKSWPDVAAILGLSTETSV